MGELIPLLLQGAWITIQVTFFGSLLAIVAAILAALGRRSSWRPLSWLCVAYIELFRGTSLLVQLFWLFFVLPLPPFNVELSAYTVAIVGLGLHIGAYGAEVMRGAISSVAKGFPVRTDVKPDDENFKTLNAMLEGVEIWSPDWTKVLDSLKDDVAAYNQAISSN